MLTKHFFSNIFVCHFSEIRLSSKKKAQKNFALSFFRIKTIKRMMSVDFQLLVKNDSIFSYCPDCFFFKLKRVCAIFSGLNFAHEKNFLKYNLF